MRTFAACLVVILAGCNTMPPGFLNTDVLEPAGMSNPTQQGVKMQGTIFQEGSLTYAGKGQIQKVFGDYIDAMRGLGWSPASVEGDGTKGQVGRLVKDTRTLFLRVNAEGDGGVRIIIQVSSTK